MEIFETAALTAQIVGLLVVVGYPIYRLLKTRSFLSFFLWTYGLFVSWGILFCLALPIAAVRLTGERELISSFPEAPVLVGIIFAGWIYPGLIALIGIAIRIGIRRDGSVSDYFCRFLKNPELTPGKDKGDRPPNLDREPGAVGNEGHRGAD
jgi:amino acid transporter